MNTLAKIVAWVRTPSDHRDCASSTTDLFVPVRDAKRVAKALCRGYQEDGDDKPMPTTNLPAGHRVVPGHGVLIVYPNGAKCSVVD